MASSLYKGILPPQYKEPALSRDLREFFNADSVYKQMSRKPVVNPEILTAQEIIEIARDANIVDERDGKPLAQKLERLGEKKVHLLVADAIDDEPYISSSLSPLIHNQKLAQEGLRLAQRACGADEAYIAVYKNVTDLDIKVPKMIGDFAVKRIRGRYPAKYRAEESVLATQTAAIFGMGSLLHLARAVLFNKPQTTTFITVAGNAVGTPCNMEVSIGLTVQQVLEKCGLPEEPDRVVLGGSMTGKTITEPEQVYIDHTSRAVLAFCGGEKKLHFNCIGCARCVHVCPEGLNPYFLYRSVKRKRFDEFRRLDANLCSSCGACSYICPARLELSDTIRQGRNNFGEMIGSIHAAAADISEREQQAFEEYMSDFHEGKKQRAQLRALHRQMLVRAMKQRINQYKEKWNESAEKRQLLKDERAAQKRLAQEAAEKERLAQEAAEQERLAQEAAEKERLAQQAAEKERLAQEAAEKERLAQEAAEQERLAQEAAEQERLAQEAAEKERLAQEAAEQERLTQEAAEQERLAQEAAEKERLAQEAVEQEAAEQEPLMQNTAKPERNKRKPSRKKRKMSAKSSKQFVAVVPTASAEETQPETQLLQELEEREPQMAVAASSSISTQEETGGKQKQGMHHGWNKNSSGSTGGVR